MSEFSGWEELGRVHGGAAVAGGSGGSGATPLGLVLHAAGPPEGELVPERRPEEVALRELEHQADLQFARRGVGVGQGRAIQNPNRGGSALQR